MPEELTCDLNHKELCIQVSVDGVTGAINLVFIILFLGLLVMLIYTSCTRVMDDPFFSGTRWALAFALLIRCGMCLMDLILN